MIATVAHQTRNVILTSLWASGGAVILICVAADAMRYLSGADAFHISEGPEQSILIVALFGMLAALEAVALSGLVALPRIARKLVAAPVLLGTSVWLISGGPAYEPWYFSLAVASLLVASVGTVAK